MKHFVITIGRQFGSLGRTIGKKLAQELGVEYYDRALMDESVEIMKMDMDDLSKYDERLTNPFAKALYPMGLASTMTQTKLFRIQEQKIRHLAETESCIIVGRCAEHILRERRDVLSVFIYAPYEQRIQNCMTDLHLSADTAKSMIKSVDKARKDYHEVYTNTTFGSIEDHDLLIDSSLLGIDGTVRLLKMAVEERFA